MLDKDGLMVAAVLAVGAPAAWLAGLPGWFVVTLAVCAVAAVWLAWVAVHDEDDNEI